MAKDTRIKIQLPSGFTDGNSKHWPKAPFIHKSDDSYYHEKVADMWMSHIGEAVASRKYIFDKLPEGYTIFVKAHNTDKDQIDRCLYGHPKKPFRSPNEFIEHFKWLMTDGAGRCTCIYCSETKKSRGRGQSSIRQVSASSEPTRRRSKVPWRSKGDFASVVELYLNSTDKEPDSDVKMAFKNKCTPDNLREGRTFKEVAEGYLQVPSFLPRVGELVLFYTNGQQLARFEPETQRFKLFNQATRRFGAYPNWKAGVISREPPQTPDLEQLKVTFDNQIFKNRHHYLIDLFPDPDGDNKELFAHIYHVSIDHIRPLSMYHEMLSGIPQEQWDKTVHNALKVTSSVALVDPTVFCREGSKAIVECRGVWVGPELWVIGDVVRMKPHKDLQIHGALIINGISLVIEDTDSLKSSVYIWGRAFTVNEKYSLQNKEAGHEDQLEQENLGNRPSCFDGYKWYPMCELDKEEGGKLIGNDKEEPCESFLGRLYESKAMEALVGTTHFDVTYEGIRQGRAWALSNRKYDQWIANQRWLIMNDRLEMLSMDTLHGQHVPVTTGFGKNELPSVNSEVPLCFEGSNDQGISSHRTSGLSINSQNEDENTDNFIADIIADKVVPRVDDDTEILKVRRPQVNSSLNARGSLGRDNRPLEQMKDAEGRTNGKHLFEGSDGRRGSRKQQGKAMYEDDNEEVLNKYDHILVKRVRID